VKLNIYIVILRLGLQKKKIKNKQVYNSMKLKTQFKKKPNTYEHTKIPKYE